MSAATPLARDIDYTAAIHESMTAIITDSGLAPKELAKLTGVPTRRIGRMLAGRREWGTLECILIGDALTDDSGWAQRIQGHIDAQRAAIAAD